MPWADCVYEDWDDCIWQDWEDCIWDKFSITYSDSLSGTRNMRLLSPVGAGSFRRPYLEGNPSYAEDNQRYPDVAVENARIQAKGETRPHMTMKQPYRYEQFQKMKYRDEAPNDRLVETPGDIMAEEVPKEYDWQWLRYLDDNRWTPTTGEWFDNRWLEGGVISWTQRFDDADWEPQTGFGSGGVWDDANQEWDSELVGSQQRVRLWDIGTWGESYRPTKLRVTWVGGGTKDIFLHDEDGNAINPDAADSLALSSGHEINLNTWTDYDIWGLAIQAIGDDMGVAFSVTNIEFSDGSTTPGTDLSVVPGSWWDNLRPRKFRMTFDEATADVSLQDKNGVEIYASATYGSGTEVYLDFAGADIARLVVNGSGDITDIEVEQQVEKGSMLGTNKRTPRTGGIGRPQRFPDPNQIQPSERIPRRTGLRTIR